MGGGKNAAYAARDERWRYIRYSDGSEALYDHQNDPNEWVNLAAKPEHAAEKTRLVAFFPQEFKSAVRPASEVVVAASPAGSADLVLKIGDEISAAEAQKLLHPLRVGHSMEARIDVREPRETQTASN